MRLKVYSFVKKKYLRLGLIPLIVGIISCQSSVSSECPLVGKNNLPLFHFSSNEHWMKMLHDQGYIFSDSVAANTFHISGLKVGRQSPKIWDENHKVWVVVSATDNKIRIYKSKDLKKWNFSGEFGAEVGSHCGVWEYAEFFPLRVDGNNETKWVLTVNTDSNGREGTQYFIGDFDGNNFHMDSNFLADIESLVAKSVWIDYGGSSYTSMTPCNPTSDDTYRIVIGRMGDSGGEHAISMKNPCCRAMTIPRKLYLKRHKKNYRLYSEPVNLNPIRSNSFKKNEVDMEGKTSLIRLHEFELWHSEISFVVPAKTFRISLSNKKGDAVILGYDKEKNTLYTDQYKAFRESEKKYIRVRLIINKTVIEVFFDEGLTTMTKDFFSSECYGELSIHPQNPDKLKYLEINQLN